MEQATGLETGFAGERANENIPFLRAPPQRDAAQEPSRQFAF
jgi:hypothetical protein